MVVIRMKANSSGGWLKFATMVLVGVVSCAYSQVNCVDFLWARRAGGVNSEFASGIAVDAAGNSYLTGYFSWTNASFGDVTLTNSGYGDVFVAKYDSAGNVLWARGARGGLEDSGAGVAVDEAGNVYVTGFFESTNLSFDNVTITNSGDRDVFLAKHDTQGKVVWARAAGGTNYDSANAIAVDVASNVFVTGVFLSPTISFGGRTLTNSGGGDVFVAKYDSNGGLLWAERGGGNDADVGNGIAIDPAGNVYVTGDFYSGTARFGDLAITNTHPGSSDMFLAKYDTGGNILWARAGGGSDNDFGKGVVADGVNSVFVTGSFNSPITSIGGVLVTNIGGYDILLAKYDSSGNVLWAKGAGGSDGFEQATGIARDDAGNVYIAGSFTAPIVAFDGAKLTNRGGFDVFVAKYDSAGNVSWAKSAGGKDADQSSGVGVDEANNVYIVGGFESATASFGSLTLTNATLNNYDIFLAKLVNRPVLKMLTCTNDTIRLSWSATTGQTFQIEYSSDLLPLSWDPLGDAVTATTATAYSSDFILPRPSQRFYRLVLLP